jgi:hypothetical protein
MTTTAPLASIGIDIGEEVFHVVGFGTESKMAFCRKIKRPALVETFRQDECLRERRARSQSRRCPRCLRTRRDRESAVENKHSGDASLANSTLMPLNVVSRLRTQTCAGCHHYSDNDHGLGGKAIWPNKSAATFSSRDGFYTGV